MKKLDVQNVLQICSRCYQKRVERKKTFQEIIDTEVNYGRDLNILKEVCTFKKRMNTFAGEATLSKMFYTGLL